MSVVVHIEEEYGYRDWLWETDMSPEEVKEFWKGIKTVNEFFFSGPVSFPGTVTQIYIERAYEEGWQVHEVPTESDPSGVYYWIVSEDDKSRACVSMPEDAWSAHIHMENDSWLKPLNEEPVLHAGYVPDEEYFSDDYEPSKESAAAAEETAMKFLQELAKMDK